MSLFTLSGIVIHGSHMGRTLGYPTANLDLPFEQGFTEKIGVYAVNVHYAGKIFGGMANIGYRPTISENGFTVEVHLFNFAGDLYGKKLTTDFIIRLRDEVKFGSLQELTRQMQQDEKAARDYLSGLLEPDADTV